MIALSHADAQPMRLQSPDVFMTTILRPLVGMMYRFGSRTQLGQRRFQRSHTSHHLPRISISNQRQIQKAFSCPQIRQITHPRLMRPGDFQLLEPVHKHRQIMVRLRRSWIGCSYRLEQQIPLPQLLKQPVPPKHYPSLGQLSLQPMLQLPSAQSRLVLAFPHYQCRHQLPIRLSPLSLSSPRIVVLSRHPKLRAGPLDVDPGQFPGLSYGPVGGCPPAFFLNSATSLIPARSHASRVYSRSNAKSKLASASAASNRRMRARNCFTSLISSGFSTRITFP